MWRADTAQLFHLITEQQNPHSSAIDQADTAEMLRIINREDARVPEAVAREIPNIARAVDGIVRRLRAGGRLFYVGAGTSGRLGVLDASECPPTYNTPPSMVQGVMAGGMRALARATEASEDSPRLGHRDLEKKHVSHKDAVVGITASGRTPYVIGAVRYARQRGAFTVALTCNPDSELARVAEVSIAPVVGPEVIAGSTRMKAGTAQKLVLNMLSTATMIRLGHVYGNYMVNVHLKNAKLVERARTILQRILGVDRAAALRVLRRAGGDLKVAILMEKQNVDRTAAVRRLREHEGNLREALENEKRMRGLRPRRGRDAPAPRERPHP